MKICIFDQYFLTMGGGERHIGVIMEILLRKHDVSLIHCGTFDKTDISRKLNLDLSKVNFIDTITDESINDKVKDLVKLMQADLFINATHFSQLYIEGLPNITLVFFPKFIYPRPVSKRERIKHKIGKFLFDEYDHTIKFRNFSYPEHLIEGYGRWSLKKSTLDINAPFDRVKIFYKNLKKGNAAEIFSTVSIGSKLDFGINKSYVYFNASQAAPAKVDIAFNTFKPADIEPGNTDKRDLGIFITRVWIDSFSLLTKLILKLWAVRGIKNYITRLYVKSRCLEEQLEYESFLKKNILIISNSKYTSGWINKLYGTEIKPVIIYPTSSTINPLYAKAEKKKYIISVGRFFTGDHSKKQLEMIKFFKQLYDTYPLARTYTFHICGGTHKEERNQKYIESCYRSSEGYPIEIHPDIKFDLLRELYAESQIFWHAAGLYEDEQNAPENFEHLGFTTIEAMSSGCVPVVIGVAGQLEVVKDNVDGFLWNTGDELISKTYRLMYDEDLRKKFSAAAVQRAGDFSYEHFEESVITTFEKVGIEM
ncbi:MAG: glycosyltransferase family 4 protein [Bacteroidota bacterium]